MARWRRRVRCHTPLSSLAAMEQVLRFAESQHGLVTRGEALTHGMTPAQLRTAVRAGILRRVHPAIFRVVGSPPSWRQRLHALVLAAGPEAAASHTSAGALWRLPGFGETRLEVVRPWKRNR